MPIEALELGGERYAAEPERVPVVLDVSRMIGGGYALRLRFDGGPRRAVHALPEAGARRRSRSTRARSTSRAEGRSSRARTSTRRHSTSPAGRATRSRWRCRADPLPRGLRRAVPGLRRRPQRGRARAPPRARARPALGEAARAEARLAKPISGTGRRRRAGSLLASMAVPKQKQSHSRTAKRRAQHKIGAPAVNACPQCHSPRRPHRVCPVCGYLRRS